MKFAFVTIKNIVLMNISPILVTEEEINENVLTIIRPNDVDQNEVPQCCFCFGYLPNNNPLNDLLSHNYNNENNEKDNTYVSDLEDPLLNKFENEKKYSKDN